MNKPTQMRQGKNRHAHRWSWLIGLLAGSAWAQSPMTQYEYDAEGNQTRILAPLDRDTVIAYDALRRPVRTTDAAGGVARLSHDGQDRLAAVTDPRNLVTGYQYSGLGDLVQLNSPDTGTTQYTHNAAGNLLARTDAKGQTTSYQYDALNRPVLVTYHDGSRVAYGWDAGGRLAQLAEYDGAGQLVRSASLDHDAQGRLVQETRVVAGRTAITGYLYANGRLETLLYPSGRLVAYSYDGAGRIAGIATTGPNGQARTVASQVQYHPFGGVKSFIHGNGLAHQRPLDTEGRLAGYSVGGLPRSLSFDLGSRIVALDAEAYGYDSLDRLVSAAVIQGGYGYSYDANGNRTAMSAGGTTFPYVIDAASNRLLAIGGTPGWSHTHDANGSIIADGTRQYVYDTRGRLVRIDSALGSSHFEIDARGRRVRKSGPLGERQYHYDEAGRLLAESTPNGIHDREYIYLGELPVAAVADGALYHLDPDHLGTPRLATDGQGTAVWRWEGGEPFGAQPPDEAPGRTGVRFVLNLRFPGQYHDQETQLHYNYFRDYDPATGRYVQSDPIGLAGGINTYGYVGGNPINVADPNGLWAQFAIGGVVGGIAGVIATGNTVGWSWNNAQAIAIGAGVGAVTGVAGAYSIGQGLLAYTSGALIGGAGGFSGNVSGQLVGGTSLNCVDWRQAGFQGFTGLVAGMAAGPAFGPLPVANPAIAAASLTGGATLLLNSMTSTGLGGFGYAGVFR